MPGAAGGEQRIGIASVLQDEKVLESHNNVNALTLLNSTLKMAKMINSVCILSQLKMKKNLSASWVI